MVAEYLEPTRYIVYGFQYLEKIAADFKIYYVFYKYSWYLYLSSHFEGN